jgi:enamine deaminase RidA (YjgF/YER057c/UK114 family)
MANLFPLLQSQAVKTPNAIYCSGQIPLTADGTFIEGSIADKTKQCIVNLEAVLKESGSAIQKVVKTTMYVIPESFITVSGCVRSPSSLSRESFVAWVPRAATASTPKTDS